MSIQYDKPFFNESGEKIPAYAIMELRIQDGIYVDAAVGEDDGKFGEHISVMKPAKHKEEGSGLYLINGPTDVDVGQRGQGTRSWPARVLFDRHSDSTPLAGELWGPEEDEWHISRGKGNLAIVGGVDRSNHTVRVELGPIPASAEPIIALLVGDVPAVDFSSDVPKPGIGDKESCHILRWKLDENGNTVLPPTELEKDEEKDPNFESSPGDPPMVENLIPKQRTPVNFSGTTLRASEDEPILVSGHMVRVFGSDDEGVNIETQKYVEVLFYISNVMDFRSLPGYEKGTTDADAQAPYHPGESEEFPAGEFRLGREDCGNPESGGDDGTDTTGPTDPNNTTDP